MTEAMFCLAMLLGIFVGIGLTVLAQNIYFACDDKPYDWEDEEW